MAVNPMQKKATTAALIAVLVTLLITGAVIALLMMKVGNLNKQIAEKRANLGKVFVLNSDVKSGQEITSEMLKLQEVEMSTVPTSAVGSIISVFNNYSLEDVKGKKGSAKTLKAPAICKATYICVFTRSGLSFITFQGSSSAKYLFPKRATFINSPKASLNL